MEVNAVKEFVWETSSLPFIFAPPFVISAIIVLVGTSILSPLLVNLGGKVVPKLRTLSPEDKSLIKTIPASTIHAIISVFMSSYILIYGLMGSNRLFSKSPLGFTTMQISLGYFVGDLIVVLLDSNLRKDYLSIVHHAAGIIGISLGLYNQGKGMFFIVYRMIAESSTPFVNVFHLFRMTDNRESKWFVFVPWTLMFTFFLSRIVVIPWHWYEVLYTVISDPAAPHFIPLFYRFWLPINYLAFDVLNVVWFRKLIRGAIKHYKRVAQRKLD